MSWRIINISKPCKISVKNNQLIYCPSDNTEGLSIPLEDISVIIAENMQVTLTNYLLSSLADYGIVLFTCNASHIPSGAFFPFQDHSRYLESASAQIAIAEPLKKQLWQNVIKQKIYNQGMVLKVLNINMCYKLFELTKSVKSGDITNCEATAASIYWDNIFSHFKRSDDLDIRNSYLNYGYAILRGIVARNLVATGLIPSFGIHHKNQLNQFNLADDIIEPFRPFIDYEVTRIKVTEQLTPQIKKQLIEVATKACRFNDEKIGIIKAAEYCTQSLAKSFKQKSNLLKLPIFDENLINDYISEE